MPARMNQDYFEYHERPEPLLAEMYIAYNATISSMGRGPLGSENHRGTIVASFNST